MQIHGTAYLHGPQAVSAPHVARSNAAAAARTSQPIADQLDLSPAAQFVDLAQSLPEIRTERVNQIRAAIAAGAYETDDKLDAALDRLLDEIG
jgi:negative regulator of flagellin synthesis FlgM